MTMGYIDAIATVLKRTPGVVNDLAKWDFGSGDEPAVWSYDPASDQCPNPVLTISEAAGSGAFYRGANGPTNGNIDFRINVWGDKGESVQIIRDIAFAAWRAMLTESFEPGGDRQMYTLAAGPPVRLPDDGEGFPGYSFSASVNISE